MVIATSAISQLVAPSSASRSEDADDDLEQRKTPALTTATACGSAETGVGATASLPATAVEGHRFRLADAEGEQRKQCHRRAER